MKTLTPGPEQIDALERAEVYGGFELFTAAMKHLDTVGQFCTVAYSRALWEQVEGYNSTQLINPDMHFIVKLLRRDPVVLFVNRPLYSYRVHQTSQGAQQARAKVLKFQVDQYNYLMQFDEAWLEGTGVTRSDQRRLFVRRDCLRQAAAAQPRDDLGTDAVVAPVGVAAADDRQGHIRQSRQDHSGATGIISSGSSQKRRCTR